MTSPLASVTATALGLALDASQLRHTAIAANIANHATEGWVPLAVDFETQMARAMGTTSDTGGRIDANALAQVEPRLVALTGQNGVATPPALDEQVAAMAENAVNYQALSRGINRYFAILSTAVSDGKR